MTTTEQSAPAAASGEAPTYKQYIGGEWVESLSGVVFESLSPFTGEVFAKAPASGRADAVRAVEAAAKAAPAWAALSPATKQALFLKAADLLEARLDEMGDALARETGAAPGMVQFQIGWAASLLRQAAAWVYRPKGELIQSDTETTRAATERRPLGVVASFGPWNGAQVLGWRAVVLPLAAGNAVVLKPSEEAPVSGGILIAQVLEEAGFPPGVLNVITHEGPAAGDIVDEFYENRTVRSIYFTGSAATARHIAAKAAAHLTPVVLELGGFNHSVILEDADLDYAARATAFSAFFHQGQVCMCTRKILIHDAVYDQFLEKLLAVTETIPAGDPLAATTIVGPVVNDKALAGVHARIDEAVQAGAKVLAGGTSDGLVMEPTILSDVPDTVGAYREETFAPLLVVQRISSDEEAVQLVNDNDYGLAFSVFTEDIGRGERIMRQIDTGAAHVNAPTINDEPHAPNGGTKNSGWGRTGIDSLDDFTEVHWTTVETGKRFLPL